MTSSVLSTTSKRCFEQPAATSSICSFYFFVEYYLFSSKIELLPRYVIENTPKLLRVCGRYNLVGSLANLPALPTSHTSECLFLSPSISNLVSPMWWLVLVLVDVCKAYEWHLPYGALYWTINAIKEMIDSQVFNKVLSEALCMVM